MNCKNILKRLFFILPILIIAILLFNKYKVVSFEKVNGYKNTDEYANLEMTITQWQILNKSPYVKSSHVKILDRKEILDVIKEFYKCKVRYVKKTTGFVEPPNFNAATEDTFFYNVCIYDTTTTERTKTTKTSDFILLHVFVADQTYFKNADNKAFMFVDKNFNIQVLNDLFEKYKK